MQRLYYFDHYLRCWNNLNCMVGRHLLKTKTCDFVDIYDDGLPNSRTVPCPGGGGGFDPPPYRSGMYYTSFSQSAVESAIGK